ncbi:P-loop NTPase fold protein [Clostridium sardiniense]|uniref:P-loop NTPase fold protein n=1 Tax=Clostridium sardiniense TaxID=29369 RepID=UPI00195E72B5|nr:P-loop NTPase fold protein [Clostridium sardiniense]MBM7835727.1 hypothetical protein [Clostridium sardiniense]
MNGQGYLNDNEIVEVVKDYINNDIYNHAILIDGEWGCGKTYFIKEKLIKDLEQYEESKKSENYIPKKVIYVSLYGIKSGEEISNIIYANIINNKNGKTKKILGSLAGLGSDFIKSKGIDINNLKDILECICSLENYILIFDDLERCNCDINEVLGYINNFVEHDGIKVILVANEKEIGKCNEEKNLELKYMLACNERIEFKELENKNLESNAFTDYSKGNCKINIDELRERAIFIFNQNIIYEKIKEKLIGATIRYYPDLREVKISLINKYIEDNNLKNILIGNIELNIKYEEKQNHINFRTYELFLFKISKLNDIIKAFNYEEYSSLIKSIGDYCFKVCVIYKSGIYKNQWGKENLYGYISIDPNSGMFEGEYGYKFVDEYVVSNRLDIEKIRFTLDSYLYEKLQDEDPLNVYCYYWLFNEEEIRNACFEIITLLKNKKYSINFFPRILSYFLMLKSIGFNKEMVEEVKKIMLDIIDKYEGKAIYLDLYNQPINEEIRDEYNKIIKKIKEVLDNKNTIIKNKEINDYLGDNELWGENIYFYVRTCNNILISDNEFINKFDISKLVNRIRSSNAKNIYNLFLSIKFVYNFDNIREFYSKDIEKIKELIDSLYGVISEEKDLIKISNLKILLDFLNEKYLRLNGE